MRRTAYPGPWRAPVNFGAMLLLVGLAGVAWPSEGRHARKYEELVDTLANPNKPPNVDKLNRNYPDRVEDFEGSFPPKYDFRAELKALDAWDRLNAEVQYALPVLMKHLKDNRYCLTMSWMEGYWENYNVGFVCNYIIERHLCTHLSYMQDEKDDDDEVRMRRKAARPPDPGFNWKGAWDAAAKDRKPSLLELQVQGFDWAIRVESASRKGDRDEQAAVLAWLRRRRDELVRSGQPIHCDATRGGGEEFDFGIPRRFELTDEEESRLAGKKEREMRNEVSKLASPNPPPQIGKNKPPIFSTAYDRAAQEKVVAAIRKLNSNFVAASPALVAARNDGRYCVTLQGPDGAPRNVTVGKLCCLLIAANINIYLPHMRAGPGTRPLYLKPDPPDIIRWWRKEASNNSLHEGRLTQLQEMAMSWASEAEGARGGFLNKREELLQVGYLQRRRNEYWSCQLPVAVDFFQGEHVVVPKAAN